MAEKAVQHGAQQKRASAAEQAFVEGDGHFHAAGKGDGAGHRRARDDGFVGDGPQPFDLVTHCRVAGVAVEHEQVAQGDGVAVGQAKLWP